MTTSDFRKAFKQLKVKPIALHKYLKHNSPKKRTTGINLHKCRRCGRTGGHIAKYELHICRLCFREVALSLGFRKYN